jgi:hypothetical protein
MMHGARLSSRHSALSAVHFKRPFAAAVVAAVGVATTTFVATPGLAAPGLAAVPSAVLADPVEAGDEATAMHLAWKNRHPVEILDERTETSEIFAQPDGTLHTRQHASPVRVRRGTGWVGVDTTLKVSHGAVVPEATTMDVRFSVGGSGPLLTVVRDGKSLGMTWPTALPAPTLAGDTATYAEVLPGVDLTVSARVDSFSEVLVVKTPAAAQNPALEHLQFGLQVQGVTLRQDASGFIQAVDAAGQPVLVSDGARMWDHPQEIAPPPSTSLRSLGEADGGSPPPVVPPDPESRQSLDLPVTLAANTLTVQPARAMLTDPATNWPVYIDPGFNGGKEIWTHVSRKNATKSYWSDKSTRGDMRVGQLWGGSSDDDWRTIVQFDVTKLKGTFINKAAVLVNVRHSADCSPSPFQLWRTNAVSTSSSVTWNSTKDKWWQVLGEVKATANKSACPKGNDEVRFAQTAVKSAFQDAATKNYGTITLSFRAKDESDAYQWKKLIPDSAYLDIDYDHAPGKPSGLAISPCYKACASPATTSSRRPSLTMKAGDADGGTLRYEYEVWDSAKKVKKVGSGTTVTGVAQGSARSWSPKSDLPDAQYYWRGRACDTYQCGLYSDWFGLKVDHANPINPKVSSEVYKDTGWNGQPGVGADFTFSPGATSDGLNGYGYVLNGAKEVPVAAGADGQATKVIAPTKDMVNTLTVKAYDTAGNYASTDYRFKVAPVGDYWYWSLDEGSGTTAASEPANSRPLTASGIGTTWDDVGKDGESAASFAGTGELVSAAPVLNTLSPSGFTVAAWVRLPGPAQSDADPVPDPGDVPEPGDGTGDDPDVPVTPPDDQQSDQPSPLPTTDLTAVSEDGVSTSAFKLGYRADVDLDADGVNDPSWCFTVAATDSATAARTSACTGSYVEAGAWVHLVGIVDPINNKIQLYVNGTPARDGVLAEQLGKTTWEAAGMFAVGRGWSGTAAAERWVGEIDEVHAAPRIWTEQEIYEKSHVADDGDAP